MPLSTVSPTKPLFDQIDTWLSELQEVKAAAAPKSTSPVKKAGLRKSAIEGMGNTSHPSEKVDNNTHDTPEGARAKENISDVEEDVQGDPVTGDSPIKADQDKVMPNIGVDQSATGEDKAIETSSAKGDKDDPGTSHPANADDVGQKYASMSFGNLLKAAEDKANNILAHLANGNFGAALPAAAPRPQQTKRAAVAAPAPQQAVQPQVDAGYVAAAAANEREWEKYAASFIEGTMRDADFDADLVGSYLRDYHQKRVEMQKKAMDDEAGEGEDHKGPPDPAGMGGMGGGDPLGGGGPPPMDGGGAGGPPPMGAGGPPPAGPGGPGGADPMAALGAAAQDAPPGGAPGAGDKAQALQDLLMVLHELGFTEEDLAQLSQGQGGAKAEEGAKLASAGLKFRRDGKFRFSEPKTAQQVSNRNRIRDYIMEITGLKA